MSKVKQIKKQTVSKSKHHFAVRRVAKIQQKRAFKKAKIDTMKNQISKRIGQAACNLVIANAIGLSGVGLYGLLTQTGAMDIHVALFVIGQVVSVIASGINVYFDVAFKDSG